MLVFGFFTPKKWRHWELSNWRWGAAPTSPPCLASSPKSSTWLPRRRRGCSAPQTGESMTKFSSQISQLHKWQIYRSLSTASNDEVLLEPKPDDKDWHNWVRSLIVKMTWDHHHQDHRHDHHHYHHHHDRQFSIFRAPHLPPTWRRSSSSSSPQLTSLVSIFSASQHFQTLNI